ncbi:RNA polymerase sigma factor, sigma-70 family [Clostridium carnis]|uniref:RNA polymerase sigma factor, sigma-70 family n=1 Tax=Clostridium carnis TaxID=1530 RepID=A0ABY6SV80_9CLOT|nr:hypothetical protein [Clostridium carnis]VDG72163.1 RNA polymerase sigma factor, sigma-70 family [Clostridium carnis]
MYYNYIESLIIKCNSNIKHPKELLSEQFRPFIINLSKRTFIHGYITEDIKNECYRSLFYCVNFYNTEKHSFVAYTTNGIKNNIKNVISKHKDRSSAEGIEDFTFTNKLELYVQNEEGYIDENIYLH